MGTANANQLIAFAFPNDDLDARTEFPRLRAEVAECYHVQWYTVDSRPYYAIPTWDDHQKNERRARGKFPTPDQADSPIAEMRGSSAHKRGDSGAGTGEQGNRGTGEQGKKPTHVPKETHDCNARDFSQEQIDEVVEILSVTFGSLMDPLEASVAVDLITEASTEPVQNLPAYITAAIEQSPDRVIGLCREARRQVERMRAA